MVTVWKLVCSGLVVVFLLDGVTLAGQTLFSLADGLITKSSQETLTPVPPAAPAATNELPALEPTPGATAETACPPETPTAPAAEEPKAEEKKEEAQPAEKPKEKPKPAPKKAPPAFPGAKHLPATGPYKPVFFDNDFSYKAKPGNEEYVIGEELKLMKFELMCTDFVFSTGGEFRHRFMSQDNRLQPGGPGQDTYDLTRWRHYFDLKAGENFRFYVEGIDAASFGEDLPTQAIDENRWDLQNAFVDVSLFETEAGSHALRYGRQELIFGRQRLLSPLDWANTRRNFEGLRYMIKEKDWKLDVFSVNPVNSATGFRSLAENDHSFDNANRDVFFSGAYYTNSSVENTNVDLYYLWLEDKEPVAGRADGSRHTLGSRIAKLFPTEDGRVWDMDLEGGYQFGEDNDREVKAGFATGVVGHTWKEISWKPRVSGLAYFGSGDKTPTDDQNNTFYTMFPLGHAYWAISDNLSGQNLLDYVAQVDLKPTDKLGLTSAYHVLNLASDGDRAYNVAGVPVGTPLKGASKEIGQALDLYGFYAMSANIDIQSGYSWFWYGDFIDRVANRDDASQFYIQTSLRY